MIEKQDKNRNFLLKKRKKRNFQFTVPVLIHFLQAVIMRTILTILRSGMDYFMITITSDTHARRYDKIKPVKSKNTKFSLKITLVQMRSINLRHRNITSVLTVVIHLMLKELH